MRLIDADKLRHELIMGRDLIGAKYTDMADTVEAIPIEWVENYWNVEDEILTYDVFTVRNNEQEVHCLIPVRTKCVQQLINDMISDWEKENEKEL